MAFVSAHAPGFDLTKENLTIKETAEGDLYCRAIAEKLSRLSSTIQIIGAYMNASPEIGGWRFKIFKGLDLLRTNEISFW